MNTNIKIILYTIFAVSATTKLVLSFFHFTHIDDLIPLAVVLEFVSGEFDNKWASILGEANYSFLNSNAIIKIVFQTVVTPFIISDLSTYAPLQYLGANLYLKEYFSYEVLILLSRLPSTLFGCIAPLLAFYVVRDELKFSNKASLIVSFFIGFSGMLNAYSAQSSSYAIGVVTWFYIIILYYRYIDERISPLKFGVYCTLICLFSYQMIIFVTALFIQIIVISSNNKLAILRYIKSMCYFGITYLPFFIVFILPKASRSINGWNTGENSEYLFTGTGLVEFLYFIQGSFPKTLTSLLTFDVYDNDITNIISVVLTAVIFYGIYKFFTDDKKVRTIGTFFLSSLVLWILILYQGKVTLSPSRHSLILLPLFACFLALGLKDILRKIRFNSIQYYIPICSIIVFLLTFSTMNLYKSRATNFSNKNFEELIQTHEIDYVIALDFTSQINFFESIRNKYKSQNKYSRNFFYMTKKKENACVDLCILLAVSHRSEIKLPDVKKALLKANEINYAKLRTLPIEITPVISSTEIDFGNFLSNGTNSFYASLIEFSIPGVRY